VFGGRGRVKVGAGEKGVGGGGRGGGVGGGGKETEERGREGVRGGWEATRRGGEEDSLPLLGGVTVLEKGPGNPGTLFGEKGKTFKEKWIPLHLYIDEKRASLHDNPEPRTLAPAGDRHLERS